MRKCIICDLDGTLSLFDRNKKNPYSRDFENDDCNDRVLFLLNSWNEQYPEGIVFFLSGRSSKYREQTEIFLKKNLAFPYILIMRMDKDNRKDVIVKEEMYNEWVKPYYEVDFVIDDRLQVCRLWYSLGLFVFNVNQGLIDF